MTRCIGDKRHHVKILKHFGVEDVLESLKDPPQKMLSNMLENINKILHSIFIHSLEQLRNL